MSSDDHTGAADGRRRRWPWVAGASLVLLAVVAAGAYVLLLVRRPPLAAGERYGIDVSHHQGPIDWEQVADDDIDFAYIKVSEGEDWTDTQGAANWSGASAAGIERGAYHFFTLCTPGVAQARHFLASIPDPGELPPSVDLELGGNCSARPPEAEVRAELDDFLDLVETETGEEVVLYVGDDWEEQYPVLEAYDRPLWLQRFVRRPDTPGWWIWQFTGHGRVDGIDGRVDVDIMRPRP